MAISVNWVSGVITVPKADTTLLDSGPPEIRQHDTDAFRLALKALEDDEQGQHWPDTHVHETETTLAGVTYARKIRILAPYTVTYEDGSYRVNLVGSNNNIVDVLNYNSVQVVPANSAGLIAAGTSLTSSEQTQLDELHKIHGLASGTDLEVTGTSRTAGAGIQQTISEDAGTVTVSRT